MTSTSPDAAVVRGLTYDAVRTPSMDTDLRSGTWTRLGDSRVLGDAVTESTLQSLADSARASAQAQGYAVGWSQGRLAGEERTRAAAEAEARDRAAERERQREEHQQAVASLRRAAQRLQDTLTRVCASVEAHTVEVALELAEAVLGREVALATDPGGDALRRALALLPGEAVVRVHLHPADRASLDPAAADLPGLAASGVAVLDDPSLARGDALVETDTAVVDASVAAALARVREVLAP